jgi:hypothetical protein
VQYNLILIDDAGLRRTYFSEVSKTLKKIERLERDLENSQAQDPVEFAKWVAFTFRAEKEAIEALEKEHDRFERFHSWIVLLSQEVFESMPEAYRFLKDEEFLYASGNAETRQVIEKQREDRDRRIENHRTRNRPGAGAASEETTEDEDFFGNAAERHPAFSILENTSDAQLATLLEDYAQAFGIFFTLLDVATTPDETDQVLRVWDALPGAFQKRIRAQYARNEGQPLESLLSGFRKTDSSTDPSAAFSAEPHTDPKLFYRKLTRLLHPDRNREENIAAWKRRMWDQVQCAYRDRDAAALKRLYLLALLRLGDLSALTIGEIRQSQESVDEELFRRQAQVKELKKSLFFGFSKKRNRDSLNRKIRKNFEASQLALTAQIRRFENLYAYYDAVAGLPERRRSKKKRGRQSGGV